MIKFIKNDFRSVSEAINYRCNGKIPKGIIILYYIAMVPVGLLLIPFTMIWSKMYLRKIRKQIEEA